MALIDETPVDPSSGWVADHVRRYVETDGADGHEWRGVRTLLLTTRGKRSGTARRTALIYGEHDGDYVLVASYGGAPAHPDWYVNLAADPEVVVQVADRVMPGTARTVEGDEREQLWRLMASIWPAYDDYQAKTSRRIPIVAITPQG